MMGMCQMYEKNDMRSYHMVQLKDTDTGHLWHFKHGGKLKYVYEQMAIVRCLDVKNLPTISADEDSLGFKL